MGRREEQRAATRGRIVSAAVACLVEGGYAATSTVAVQRRAQVSRGALLHHFPTRAALFEATVERLVALNEAAVREALARQPAGAPSVERALRALRDALARPAFLAELELWAVSRTDPQLRTALRRAERVARRDLNRVVAEVFGPKVTGSPRYPALAALTTEFLRGLALSGVLRERGRDEDRLIVEWARLIRAALTDPDGRETR